MFWGNRVAIAGPATLASVPADAPAEQMRQLAEFGYFLNRQNMPVDAYLDLADEQIKGAITWKTRYLILARDIPFDAKDTGPQATRAKNLNDAIQGMKKEAIEKGLFVISVDNFLNVVGYRAPRSARDNEYKGFVPGQPRAGIAAPGLPMLGRPRPEAQAAPANDNPPAEEKKAMEKEEK
jgi:hypothetical protein